MDIKTLVNISAKAWAFPILWNMHAGVPGRQAPLLHATGAGRTAFAQSMEHLIDIGLLERNPGYGHPLRPEFRLTALGQEAASLAHAIHAVTGDNDTSLIRKSWTLPILTALHEPRHFNDLRRSLGTITDRALSYSLKAMEERDWVARSVNDNVRPPRSTYSAINTGAQISQITGPHIRLAQH